MKFLIIDDEHELYKMMYSDLFSSNKYDVEEINKFSKFNVLEVVLNKIYFSEKINRHLFLPFKELWNSKYTLSEYIFDFNEQYWIVVLNGSLRNYYSKIYFRKLKKAHSNVKLCMVMYDSSSNPSAKRSFDMIEVFDKVFSFDIGDCDKYGFEHIYSTLSYPPFVKNDYNYQSNIFFVGYPGGRENILYGSMKKILSQISNCVFIVPGSDNIDLRSGIQNRTISYSDELMYTFNTECILEVVREGQTGVTLRTCESVLFNKKLLTNNKAIKEMPFYNPEYMSVFSSIEDLNLDFICNDIKPDYKYNGWFSPLIILERLIKL